MIRKLNFYLKFKLFVYRVKGYYNEGFFLLWFYNEVKVVLVLLVFNGFFLLWFYYEFMIRKLLYNCFFLLWF